MITSKQLPVLIAIMEALKKEEMSITKLQQKLKIKRSTLIYYLNILDNQGFLEREVKEKEQGKPTLLKFNKKKYKEEAKKQDKKFKEEKEEMLNHPLTFEILDLLKKDATLTKKELHGKTTDYFRKAFHLNWLINEGLIVQEFSITPKGKKFIEEHKKNINSS